MPIRCSHVVFDREPPRCAREVDVVMNVGAFRSGDLAYVEAELRETAYPSSDGVLNAARLAAAAGAAFIKNGTGLSPRGADIAEIAAIRATVGPEVGVKAAGSIRHLESVMQLLAAGASRIGPSHKSAGNTAPRGRR